jgi:hypothetical protein
VQLSQSIELLVENLSPPAHANFPDLVQPLRAVTRCINLLTRTANTCGWRIDPEAVKRLDSRNALR